jgi:hypothetical protein
VRKTRAGLAGLIVIVAWLLSACGGQLANSAKDLASSIAASHSAIVTHSPVTPPPSPANPTSAPALAPPTATGNPGGGVAPDPSVTPRPTAPTAAPTASPAATAASPAATATSATAGGGSGFPWLWFWIAVAIAAVVVLTAWVLISRHKRRVNAATGWQTRKIDAYAMGSALHDAMAAAEAPGALGAEDAGRRWADIQRRADDFGQVLYGMQQTVPGDEDRILITSVLAALQAARSAMDAERSAAIDDGSLSGIVRDRLAFFASCLRSLRQPDVHRA